jgi:hypothetical protein
LTLCIAAACQHKDEPRIVLCTDWQLEAEGLGKSETTNKMDWVKDGWPALTADVLYHADALIGVYANHLAELELTGDNILEEMKVPAEKYKAVLANDYIQQSLGISYEYFLEHGKERFPEDVFREKMDEINRIKLGASLIIAGFGKVKKIGPYEEGIQSFLCVVQDSDDHKDVVRLETDFATIGSGGYVASASLYSRSQHWEMPLLYTIYSVYEAHKAAGGKVPGVGHHYSIDVLRPGEIKSLSDAGYDYCDKLYSRFGPRPIEKRHKDKFEMRDEFLEPFDTKAKSEWD